jgi:hypothetical protein
MRASSSLDASIGSGQSVKPWIRHAPAIVTVGAIVILAIYGRIALPLHYSEFANQSALFGIPHAADVLSNIGFALVALWGWFALYPQRASDQLRAGWPGYRLFLIALFLTAFGSGYFHLDPDHARLIWDMLPIALVCVGLLVGVRGDTRPELNAQIEATGLGLYAVASIAWWVYTDRLGADDLRPYLLLQGLPLLLIPLWQAIYRAPRTDRIAFAAAMLLYVVAKLAELLDRQIANALGFVSGHTLKHLIATMATAAVVWGLTRRFSAPKAREARRAN